MIFFRSIFWGVWVLIFFGACTTSLPNAPISKREKTDKGLEKIENIPIPAVFSSFRFDFMPGVQLSINVSPESNHNELRFRLRMNNKSFDAVATKNTPFEKIIFPLQALSFDKAAPSIEAQFSVFRLATQEEVNFKKIFLRPTLEYQDNKILKNSPGFTHLEVSIQLENKDHQTDFICRPTEYRLNSEYGESSASFEESQKFFISRNEKKILSLPIKIKLLPLYASGSALLTRPPIPYEMLLSIECGPFISQLSYTDVLELQPLN